MIITLTPEDLREMPAPLREQLLQFLSISAGEAVGTSGADARESDLEPDSDFKFVAPPRGARHPTKKLVNSVPVPADCNLPTGTAALIQIDFDPHLGSAHYLKFISAYLYVDLLHDKAWGKVYMCASPTPGQHHGWQPLTADPHC